MVYNRVENIETIAKYVQNLVPECNVGIIHGQMAEKQLEQEMFDFMEQKYNVLVCTTIIETPKTSTERISPVSRSMRESLSPADVYKRQHHPFSTA